MNRIKENELYNELNTRDPLKAWIFLLFLNYHRGIDRAITIDDFMVKYELEGKIPRRSFRKFYAEEIPVAYVNVKGKRGIYWPNEPKDMKPIRDLRKKAMSMLVRIKRLEDKHRDLMEPEQLEMSSMREIG